MPNWRPIANAFCPTGEGGGVDPTCSPGSAGSNADAFRTSLKPLERDILKHRLSGGTISEVLAEEGYAEQDVEEVEAMLLKGNYASAYARDKDIANAVLQDAVEGNTYLGSASAESNQKQAAIYRAGESLAEKVGRLIGKKVTFPDY